MQVTIARLDENVGFIRERFEGLPCKSNGRRISDLTKTVNALSANGLRSQTRVETAWLATKIAAAIVCSMAGLLLAIVRVLQ
jgi:hypothetical protein